LSRQLATAALLIYSGFAALYYAKVNPPTTDDFGDIFRRRRRRRRRHALPVTARDKPFAGLDDVTFQRIIEAADKAKKARWLPIKDDNKFKLRGKLGRWSQATGVLPSNLSFCIFVIEINLHSCDRINPMRLSRRKGNLLIKDLIKELSIKDWYRI